MIDQAAQPEAAAPSPEDAGKELATPRKRMSPAIKSCSWALGVVVVIFIGLFVWSKVMGGVVPTGDPLFDRYARIVAKRIDSGDFYFNPFTQQYSSKGYAAAVPDNELAEWEDDFGDNPRYWELRYWCSTHSKEIAPEISHIVSEPSDFLRLAIDRGIATTNTRLVYYGNLKEDLQQKREALAASAQGGQLTEEQKARIYQQYLDTSKIELDFLNETVALDDESAWAYYERAFYYFDEGMWDEAYADLNAGNDAPRLTMTEPFPYSFVRDEMLQGNAPGNRVVTGAIWNCYLHDMSFSNFITIKDHAKEAQVAVNLGADYVAPFNAWHRFGCRMGTGETVIQSLVGLVLIGYPRCYMVDEFGSLSPEQTNALWQLRTASKRAQALYKHHNNSIPHHRWNLNLILNPRSGRFRDAYRGLETEVACLHDVAPIFEDMLAFDYATLELPPELADYELSDEQRRKDAERGMRIRQQQQP